jgi:hypothetical protein
LFIFLIGPVFMRFLLFFVFMNISFGFSAFSCFEESFVGDPYSNAMGSITIFSLHKENPALLTEARFPELVFTYKNHYLTSELNRWKASFLKPFQECTVNFLLEGSGYEHYNDLVFSSQIAKKISSSLSIGTGIHLHGLYYTGSYERLFTVLTRLGGSWANEYFLISLWSDNFLHAALGPQEEMIRYPISFVGGFRMALSEEARYAVEIENTDFTNWRVKAGFEYHTDIFAVRCGAYTNPLIPTLGMGIFFSGFTLDVGTQYSNQLGIVVGVGLKCVLKKE